MSKRISEKRAVEIFVDAAVVAYNQCDLKQTHVLLNALCDIHNKRCVKCGDPHIASKRKHPFFHNNLEMLEWMQQQREEGMVSHG